MGIDFNTLEFLTVDEVAERLRVSGRTVRNLIDRQSLRAFKVGREWRITPEDVTAYLEMNSSVSYTTEDMPVSVQRGEADDEA